VVTYQKNVSSSIHDQQEISLLRCFGTLKCTLLINFMPTETILFAKSLCEIEKIPMSNSHRKNMLTKKMYLFKGNTRRFLPMSLLNFLRNLGSTFYPILPLVLM